MTSFSVNMDLIPDEMKALKNWLLWKYEDRTDSKGNVKKTKVPYQVNGKKAESTNPDTWASFENVLNTFERFPDNFNGIGFVFSEDSGIMGLDFDHIKDSETGEWNKEAIEEITSLNSYAEMSPSGTGAHVICIAEIPGKRRRAGPWEMYENGRYFTVTGDHIEGTAKNVNKSQEAVNGLYNKWFPSVNTQEGKKKKSPELSDEEVIALCRNAKNADKFNSLYAGNIKGFTSQSEADLSLCSIIAFYTQDEKQLNKLFCGSGLYRDKWDREDYGAKTLEKAVSGLTEVYDPEKKGKSKSSEEKPKKISVPFDVVADGILKNYHIFSMRDNGELYLYKDGVYKSKGTEAILDTEIRNLHNVFFVKYWNIINPAFTLTHIPKATTKYVGEVLAYIKAYTHIDRDEIDINQDRYINFKNGLFDLDEWKLINHTPEIRNIAQVPVTYDSTSTCPVIDRYFTECQLPNESIEVLTEFAGYCLTTDVRLQKAVMLYGKGANGKSVFINLLKTILGKYYVSVESLHNLEIDKYRVANLYGKRLNAFPDLKDTPLQTNEVFNILTGNDLELTGEKKYQHDFRFKPTVKLLFSANKIPFAYSDNYAYYRRWILIEFPKTFENDEIDEKILEKLTTEDEKSGFLNLMLEGLKRLLKNRRFSYDLGVDEIEKQYLLHSDNVTVFEEQCLRDCSENEEPNEKNLVYNLYKAWCDKNNLIPAKPKTFTRKLDKIGRKIHNTTKWIPEEKKKVWFSCYFNTIVDFKKGDNS